MSSKFDFGKEIFDEQKVNKILKMDVDELRQGMIDKEFTSVDLMRIFGSRCQRDGRDLNFIIYESYSDAMVLAK